MNEFFLFTVALITSLFLTPQLLIILEKGKLIKENYQGIPIPSTAGLIIPIVFVFSYVLGIIFSSLNNEAYICLGFISLISLTGFLDDVAGNWENKGFRGHFSRLLFQGELTTGSFKAIMGGLVAILAAITFHVSWLDTIINVLLISLTINFFNLLDVCPGRSIKMFFLMALVVIIFMSSHTAKILLYPLSGVLIGYAKFDFQGKAMLGDTGSNVLGLAIGLSIMAGGSRETRMILMVILLLLHILAEYYSFSQLISKYKILFKLDRLGRRD